MYLACTVNAVKFNSYLQVNYMATGYVAGKHKYCNWTPRTCHRSNKILQQIAAYCLYHTCHCFFICLYTQVKAIKGDRLCVISLFYHTGPVPFGLVINPIWWNSWCSLSGVNLYGDLPRRCHWALQAGMLYSWPSSNLRAVGTGIWSFEDYTIYFLLYGMKVQLLDPWLEFGVWSRKDKSSLGLVSGSCILPGQTIN